MKRRHLIAAVVTAAVGLLVPAAAADVPIPCAGTWNPHGGGAWDINVPGDETGNPVRAYWQGRVIDVERWDYSYGWHVLLDHPNDHRTLYAHLSAITVERGERVSRGELIGRVGMTGNASGPHLHFEIR